MSDTRKITMEDTKIQAWSLDRLKPAENNHKKHSDESTTKLAKSLADIGQIQPVVVDKDGEIIAGHGRWMAAQRLGWEKIKVIQVPVSRDIAIKARIADNLMSNQDIDHEKLSAELAELSDLASLDDMDLDLGSMIIDDGLSKLVGMDRKEDYGLDEDALADDIIEDSKRFTKENEKIMDEAENGVTALHKVFGFKNVTPAQARSLKDFMAIVMDERPEDDPAAALTGWAEEIMG